MKTVSKQHPLFVGTAVMVLSLAALYGCRNFLEDASAPQGTLNDQSLLNQAGVEGNLIAAYRAVEWNTGVGGAWGSAVSNWVWGSVTSDDAYKGSEASDQPAINDIEAYHWSTADAEGYLNGKWRAVYEGVVRSNATLSLLKKLLKDRPNEMTAADANGIEGEALFLRAHFHFEGYRMWGSIPYYKEDDTDFRKANVDTATVLANILADLDAAIAKLPATPRLAQKGRATSWTAKAYKGRVLVYKASVSRAAADWTAAQAVLADVKNNGPYALESSFDRVYTGFKDRENGPETIFAYQASANDGEPSGNNANYGERLNFPHSGSPFACCGFHQPSQNLVNFFKVDAAGLPLALSDPTWNTEDSTFAGNPAAVDPRLDWTVGRDGVPFKDWGLHARGWIRAPAYGGFYSPKKHINENASNSASTVGWVPTQLNSVNIHIYRYADLLLMLAEADVETGQLEAARQIVNDIRARAAVRVQGCGLPTDTKAAAAEVAAYPQCAGDTRMAVPINDPSVTWATYRVGQYTTPWTDQAAARTMVQYERRLELATEGQRFFDLRRYGTFQTVLNAYVAREKSRRLYLSAAEPLLAKHRWFPIPSLQIQLSKVGTTSRLTQNAGW